MKQLLVLASLLFVIGCTQETMPTAQGEMCPPGKACCCKDKMKMSEDKPCPCCKGMHEKMR